MNYFWQIYNYSFLSMWKLTLGYRIIFTTLEEIIQYIVSLLLHVEIFLIIFLNLFILGTNGENQL
jgi:hypothetical protein